MVLCSPIRARLLLSLTSKIRRKEKTVRCFAEQFNVQQFIRDEKNTIILMQATSLLIWFSLINRPQIVFDKKLKLSGTYPTGTVSGNDDKMVIIGTPRRFESTS